MERNGDGSMLLITISEDGRVREHACSHTILKKYHGKQRALGFFLAKEDIKKMKKMIDKADIKWIDLKHHKFIFKLNDSKESQEPDGGDDDFSDTEFAMSPPKDDRQIRQSILHDFFTIFGRSARTGEVFQSTAMIRDCWSL